MTVSEFRKHTRSIFNLLDSLEQADKIKNKDIRILLGKVVRKYGEKVVNK